MTSFNASRQAAIHSRRIPDIADGMNFAHGPIISACVGFICRPDASLTLLDRGFEAKPHETAGLPPPTAPLTGPMSSHAMKKNEQMGHIYGVRGVACRR